MDFNVMDFLLKIVVLTTGIIVSIVFQSYTTYGLKPIIQQEDILLATTPIMDKYVYVDKTWFVQKLLADDQTRYFFARPKRFGKTMFLRILQAVFDRNRKPSGQFILKGTNISNSDFEWETLPVMYFDFSGDIEQAFEQELARFERIEKINNIPKECVYKETKKSNRSTPAVVRMFCELLCAVDGPTVVLVDEYDHNILKHSSYPKELNFVTDLLTSFSVHIKRNADRVKLSFVTGVTTSAFMVTGYPGADFTVISDVPDYGELAGYTEDEFKFYFREYIDQLAGERGVAPKTIEQEVKDWYDGFTFTGGMEKLYNPDSIRNYFLKKEAKIYWSDSGRPTHVWNQLKKRPAAFDTFKSGNHATSDLRGFQDVDNVNPQVLLFEGGYLSIKEYHRGRANPYVLGFPNREVSFAFCQDLVEAEKLKSQITDIDIQKMKNAIEQDIPDFDNFIFIAGTSIRRLALKFESEAAFHGILWALMKDCHLDRLELPGYTIQDSKIDIYAETYNTYILLELKYNRHSAREVFKAAQEEIRHFIQRGKNILAAGVNFVAAENVPHPKTKKQVSETVLSDWYGELLGENGTLIRSYSHVDGQKA